MRKIAFADIQELNNPRQRREGRRDGGKVSDEKKSVEEMDSEEFIAHLFYNVLGGVYAASEEDARNGIIDMIENRDETIKELQKKAEGRAS